MITYKVKRGADGQWYASIVGGNGEIVFTGEGHPRKQAAVDACALVVSNTRGNNYEVDVDVDAGELEEEDDA